MFENVFNLISEYVKYLLTWSPRITERFFPISLVCFFFYACSKSWVLTSIVCYCALDMQNHLKIHKRLLGFWIDQTSFFIGIKLFSSYTITYEKLSVFIVSSERGDKRKKNQSETKYILLFNYQRGCKELCLVSNNSYRYHFSKMYL